MYGIVIMVLKTTLREVTGQPSVSRQEAKHKTGYGGDRN